MTDTLKNRLAGLPAADRRLLAWMMGAALLALAIGIMGGLLTALARGGMIEILPETVYRFLTLHGVSIFFYWLYLAQVAILLGFAAVENGDGGGLRGRRAAWVGFVLIAAGFAFSMSGAHMGTPLLYDGAPALAGDEMAMLLTFNLGYLLLGLGLMAAPVAAIITLLGGSRESLERCALNMQRGALASVERAAKPPEAAPGEGKTKRLGSDAHFGHHGLSAVGFALFAWAGFLILSGFAAIYAFVPGALWALGLGPFPASHSTDWHILFHNMHYLPLMATVIVWYVLVRALVGVKSAFGERFSKIVFAMYLVFVPPTSLYHMFLEPDLPGAVRVTGSLLSLFVSVPTLTAFLIIVASLEIHARARGASGLFGWIKMLPWRHPAMAAMGAAVLNMGLGLALAFVLIQEKLAPLLSDTFFVPGYFHFFTVGTVSLTLLAALAVMAPGLTGGRLWRPGLLRQMPWLASLGLLLFGGAGVAAGYMGVPRRVIDVAYGGEAPAIWPTLMGLVGVGGAVMALALSVFALGIAVTLFKGRAEVGDALPDADWSVAAPKVGATAWTGPLSVLMIVGAMYVFTAFGFELMHALPLDASGGGHAH